MISDIQARLVALGEQASEEKIRGIVAEAFSTLKDDKEFVRRMRFGSPEPKLVGTKYARWGLNAADIEFLYDMQSSLQGQRKVSGGAHDGPSETLTAAFRSVSDAYYLSDAEVREVDRRALDDMFPRVPKHEIRGMTRSDWVESQMRAMDTSESGYGSQLIGAQYVGDLWSVSRELGTIAPLFRSFEMTDPTAYLPVEVDFPEMMFVSESTANNSSNYSTTKTGSNRVTVTAKKFVIHQMWSGEMEEDSIIPFVPFLRAQAAKSIAYYLDSLILNGDTTNSASNINDSSDPDDTKHFLAMDGLRHAALVDNTGNLNSTAGAVTLDDFRKLRALMRSDTYVTDWGRPINRNDLVYITDPYTADYIELLDEVVQASLVAGAGANLLTGQVGRALGAPVVTSFAQKKSLATGFVHNSAGNNFGNITAVNVNGGVIGQRRMVKLETERLPATDQTRLVYSLRNGFGRFSPTGAASGIEWAAHKTNITL